MIASISPLSIPSPAWNAFKLGPLTIHAYALMIILGIIACVTVSEYRWKARGGTVGDIQDLALLAVPFGVVGARLYHVATDNDLYFGHGEKWYHMFFIWDGGLGIWGAIVFGVFGAWIVARRKGIAFAPAFDTVGPCLLLAQGVGRWGNYFNQELFGRPTNLPWGLRIAPENRPPGYEQYATFHPTFLYESIWDIAMFFVVIWAEKRWRLGHGRVFALYVSTYCFGRAWIESLRIDDVELHDVLGLRWSDWMAIILFIAGLVYFVWVGRTHPGREAEVYVNRPAAAVAGEAGSAATAVTGASENTDGTDDTGGVSNSGRSSP